MSLPPALQTSLEQHLGTPITAVQHVSGGDINEAAQVTTASATYFLKWNIHAPAGMFPAEAQGLALLQQAGGLRTPTVIQVTASYLLLEWLPLHSHKAAASTAEQLGAGLAALHQYRQPAHGLDHDNFIGRLPQPNTPEIDWLTFYREHRLRFQMTLARKNGYLPVEREKLLTKLLDKLPDLLPVEVNPSLLHGDLWGGNYAALTDGTPVIYDPAVYYGHREVEIAFTELFGGFSSRFYAAYNAAYPLEPGYQERKALYQLYPILVHLNLFGGSYGAQADQIAQKYVGK